MTIKNRGFAAMSIERRQQIASMGGKSVPAEQRAFSKDRDLAIVAAKKGGRSVNPAKRSFAVNHELASVAGRKGGKMSRGK